MRTGKITNLTVSHFVAVRSAKGGDYSVVSISADGLHIPELHITGATQPNSGKNIVAVFRGASETSIVGWLDPITNAPVVVIPSIIAYSPALILTLLPLLLVLLLALPNYRDIFLCLIVASAAFLTLIPSIGWPGVAYRLRKSQTRSDEK